jgi:flavin-dependent dehydrogenase
MQSERVDALVIGAGPAGTVAASILQQRGHHVAIVERERFPRFVIGESLLPGCMLPLEAAGFIDAIEAHGFQKKFGAKFLRGDELCDFDFDDKFTAGYGWTWQVTRADFDRCLADAVAARGVKIDYQTTVEAVRFEGEHSFTSVRDAQGQERTIEARFLVDASGYGRVLPRLLGLDRPSNLPERCAFFAHLKDDRRNDYFEPNRILIVSHVEGPDHTPIPGVWAWVIPLANGRTSVGFVGDPAFFARFGNDEAAYRAMLATEPHTAERFRDAELLLEPRVLRGWSTTTDKFYGPGYALVGNVTEFLDPIFSSGVTLAVASSHRAAELAARQLHGEQVDWQADFEDVTRAGVGVFRSYVNAWYEGTLETIFYADNPDPEVKRRICSVLAGYVWDQDNPYVKRHDRAPAALAARIRAESTG